MKVSQGSEKSREVPSAEKFPQLAKMNQKRRVNSTRVSTTTELPGVNRGWKQSTTDASVSIRDFHPGVANHHLGPIREFHGSHGSPNGDCRSIRTSRISSDQLRGNDQEWLDRQRLDPKP